MAQGQDQVHGRPFPQWEKLAHAVCHGLPLARRKRLGLFSCQKHAIFHTKAKAWETACQFLGEPEQATQWMNAPKRNLLYQNPPWPHNTHRTVS